MRLANESIEFDFKKQEIELSLKDHATLCKSVEILSTAA